MTAQINRRAPFVDETGGLTLYGWSVLKGLWDATGGAVPIDAVQATASSLAPVAPPPAPLTPPVDVGPVSTQGIRRAWAVMSVQAGSTAESTTDDTPRKIAAWNTDGISMNMVPDHTTGNDITAVVVGTYDAALSMSFTGTAAKQLDIEIYVGGVASGFAASRTLDAAGAVGPVSIAGKLDLAPGDTVEVYHSTPDGGSAMTVTEAQLSLTRIGDN